MPERLVCRGAHAVELVAHEYGDRNDGFADAVVDFLRRDGR